jgi:hypothetical protein
MRPRTAFSATCAIGGRMGVVALPTTLSIAGLGGREVSRRLEKPNEKSRRALGSASGSGSIGTYGLPGGSIGGPTGWVGGGPGGSNGGPFGGSTRGGSAGGTVAGLPVVAGLPWVALAAAAFA